MATQARQRRTPAAAAKASGRKTAGKAAGTPVSDARLREFYRNMLLIRRFEERAARAYTEALVGGYCHLNLGEEAAVVGLMPYAKPLETAALPSKDDVIAAIRQTLAAVGRRTAPSGA